jgi:N-methylhydantoinase B/oxoprolinase/acetone carboxylase alpha subunit
LERDPQAVLSDVLDGYITADQARDDYGAAIDLPGMTVNAEATMQMRKERQSPRQAANP